MSGTLHGYDVAFWIGKSGVLELLIGQVLQAIPLQIGNVDFLVPVDGINFAGQQVGVLTTPPKTPTPKLELGLFGNGTTGLKVEVVLGPWAVKLDALPVATNVGTTLLPKLVSDVLSPVVGTTSTTKLTLLLKIATNPALPHEATIEISLRGTPTIEIPTMLPALAVPAPLAALIDVLGVKTPIIDKASYNRAFATAVKHALEDTVVPRIQALFPLLLPIRLPALPSPCELLEIYPRTLELALFQGDSAKGTQDTLAFFVQLLPPSADRPLDLEGFKHSELAEGRAAAITLANTFLVELLCCALTNTGFLEGLVDPHKIEGDCCGWDFHKDDIIAGGGGGVGLSQEDFEIYKDVKLAGLSFGLTRLKICVGPDGIKLSAKLRQGVQSGIDAYFTVDVGWDLKNENGVLGLGAPIKNIQVDVKIAPWIWVLVALGLLVLPFVGGPFVAILVSLEATLEVALKTALDPLGAPFGQFAILPADLTKLLGFLEPLDQPVIDDVHLTGNLVVPVRHDSVAQASDQVLEPDELFDLDRGVVLQGAPGVVDPTADLGWRATPAFTPPKIRLAVGTVLEHIVRSKSSTATMADRALLGNRSGLIALRNERMLRSEGAARLVMVSGPSFASLTEAQIAELDFETGSTGIVEAVLPISVGPPPMPTVFAVRTTDGRYAKAAAWCDPSHRLHLHYLTYATPVPLVLQWQWTIARGDVVGSGVVGLFTYVEYNVSRHARVRAVPSGLAYPLAYRWLWNGSRIKNAGVLSDGITQYQVLGDVIELTTQMAAPLHGQLCVEATDAAGRVVTVCRDLAYAGTEREYDRSRLDEISRLQTLENVVWGILNHGPVPDPSPERVTVLGSLLGALANGLGVELGSIRLR